MRVVLNDGTQFDVGGLKVVESGAVLFEDREREKTIGFLPHNQFQYILTEEVMSQIETSRQRAASQRAGQGGQQQPVGTRQTVPAQQQRSQVQQQPSQPGHVQQETSQRSQGEQETQRQNPRNQ